VKLYDYKLAPNPRRVRIFLAEKRIEVPTVQVDMGKGETRQPAFLAKNPMGALPVLELDDGTYLAESVAICRYFEEQNPEPPLFGTDAKDKALVEMWQRRMEIELFLAVIGCFRHTHDYFKGRITQVSEYGELCRKAAVRRLEWLDEELKNRAYITGERYTVADITALCAVDFGRASDIRIGSDQKNLARWYDAVSSRPSARA
jgi:glutathione S-transferase